MAKSIWSRGSEALKYSQARPAHPIEIADKIVRFLGQKYVGPLTQAIDVGCGTGLSTKNLFGRFNTVIGVDESEAMIEQAQKANSHPSARFVASRAERLPVEDSSTQLVMAGKAIHYFDADNFFKEADRVLEKNGVICYYSMDYPVLVSPNKPELGEQVTSVFHRYLTEICKGYWPVNPYNGVTVDFNRRNYYMNVIKPPYDNTVVDETIKFERSTSLLTFVQEMDTLGAFVTIREREGNEHADRILGQFVTECREICGQADPSFTAVDAFFVVMSRHEWVQIISQRIKSTNVDKAIS